MDLNLTTLLSKDLKRLKIKKLSDEEFHQLLVSYYRTKNKKKRTEYRNKIIEHLLPFIVMKCKNLGIDDSIISSTDFINSCVLEVINNAIDSFDIKRQDKGKCSLFIHYINYFLLNAIKSLKRIHGQLPDQDYTVLSITDIQNLNDPGENIHEFDITTLSDIELDSFFSSQEDLVSSSLLKYPIELGLLELPPRATAIVVLTFGLRGLKLHSFEEVSKMLGLSRKTAVAMRLSTLNKLRKLLKFLESEF
ncbi:MAG: hypothetical protein ACTSX6_04025 [Candidatus Heimdallarchaeaceae archaeon]